MIGRRLWRRFSWAVKSMSLNACGSVIDYALLFVAAKLLLWPTPAATALGLACGASFNFLMNRRYAFHSHDSITAQAMRYALVIGVLMSIHAVVAWTLRDVVHLPLLPAKLLADLGVLSFTQPFALKRFVFRAQVSAPAGLAQVPAQA